MDGYRRILLLINLLWICIEAESNSNDRIDLLPKSIIELKKYYEVVENLEQRGVLTKNQAKKEKQLYIEYGSKLIGKDKLLTTQEFLESDKRESIISLSNVVAVLAGIIVFVSGSILILIFILPNLANVPVDVWEKLLYFLAFSFMFLSNHLWLVFFGCLVFFAALFLTFSFHNPCQEKDIPVTMSWILFFIWSMVALYQKNREAGYLAIIALESALGFVIIKGELITEIGFENEKLIPSGTLSSFFLIMIGTFLHFTGENLFTIPFTRPLLFIGTFVYFVGLLILSSRLYYEENGNRDLFFFLQFITFVSGLASMLFGPMFGILFIQSVGGTMFVLWLLEKYAEIRLWEKSSVMVINLFVLGILL